MDDRYKHIVKHQWEKGQSGNPAGRPNGAISKKTILTNLLEMELDADDKIISKLKGVFPELFRDGKKKYQLLELLMMRHILTGLTSATPERATIDILDRVIGKPLQQISLEDNPEGGPTASSAEILEALIQLRKERAKFEASKKHKDASKPKN